ncbi:MAG: hypothetical protein CFE21_11035 [Bacteroidetes bacterium B1(2017)]|nr:MAG: hypothetical protein CFE21_11035 [Bacteroidetes bacterium B1(2017)]
MTWRKNIGIFPWHRNQELKLLRSGESFFDELLSLIAKAKLSIHFHVYIFEGDTTGKVLFDALLSAAKRGVEISLVMDGYGSGGFPKTWETTLLENKVELSYFSKFKFAFKYHTGLRMHHKIFIFDNEVAFIGGINISDSYSGFGKSNTWLDYGIKMQGNVVLDLLRICYKVERGILPLTKEQKNTLTYPVGSGTYKARILQNHWLLARFGISRQYRQTIRQAQHEIILIASYFLPSPALKRILKKAAKRGVKIQLILGGISDVKSMKYAANYFYSDLLAAGVEIWEWEASILHAKLAFIDSDWMCIGSYNLNHLSDFGSLECNIEIRDKEFQETSKQQVLSTIKSHSHQVSVVDYQKQSNWFVKLRNYFSYRIISGSLKLLFYFMHEPKKHR